MDAKQIDIATRMANAKRPSAKLCDFFEKGEFYSAWVPRLNGMNVSSVDGHYKFAIRADAIEAAREMKAHAINALQSVSVPLTSTEIMNKN